MTTISMLQQGVIPGFHTLRLQTREQFTQTSAGQALRNLVNKYHFQERLIDKSTSYWEMLTGADKAKKQKMQNDFNVEKVNLRNTLKKDHDYKLIKLKISFKLLKKILPQFELLNKKQQKSLCFEKEVQEFVNAYYSIESNTQTLQDKLANDWKTKFYYGKNYEVYRRPILAQQIKKIVDYYPTLNYGKQTNLSANIPRGNSLQEDLQHFFYFHFEALNLEEMEFINLDELNNQQAKIMADATINAYIKGEPLDLRSLIKQYEQELFQTITTELSMSNSGILEEYQKDSNVSFSALSYLWRNPALARANQFVNDLANAHGFIQATSFSTQNENSFLAILDIYNYAIHKDRIAEAKTVLTSLLEPLRPLLDEYRDIGLYEKNLILKFIRTLIPLLIAVAVIVGLMLLVSALALSELALLAVFIPAILIGLGVASLYVAIKDTVYKELRETLYGGPFEIPEFQVNERMLKIFGRPIAEQVRVFYIRELILCDQKEEQFLQLKEYNLLTEEAKKQRDENRDHRYHLALEWYDIHSNGNLGIDQVPKMVDKTLTQTYKKEYDHLTADLKAEENSIKHSIHIICEALKANLVRPENMPAAEIKEIKYQPGLFKAPKSIDHENKIHEIFQLREVISTQAR